MKKILIIILLFNFMIIMVNADDGKLNIDSIVSCNDKIYRNHSQTNHWHLATKNEDGSFSATGDIIDLINPCNNAKIEAIFSKCVDGDTAKFIIDDEVKTVRFLAIDTPESTTKKEKYGIEASKFTCDKLTNAKKIFIEYDNNSDKTDKYGRILGWIFIDDVLLQKELIKNGYAEVAYLYDKYTYTEQLKYYETDAKEKKINIWSDQELVSSSSIVDTKKINSNELIFEVIIIIIAFIIYLTKKKIK